MVKGPKGDARRKSAVVNIFVKNEDMDEVRKDLIRMWEEAWKTVFLRFSYDSYKTILAYRYMDLYEIWMFIFSSEFILIKRDSLVSEYHIYVWVSAITTWL